MSYVPGGFSIIKGDFRETKNPNSTCEAYVYAHISCIHLRNCDFLKDMKITAKTPFLAVVYDRNNPKKVYLFKNGTQKSYVERTEIGVKFTPDLKSDKAGSFKCKELISHLGLKPIPNNQPGKKYKGQTFVAESIVIDNKLGICINFDQEILDE